MDSPKKQMIEEIVFLIIMMIIPPAGMMWKAIKYQVWALILLAAVWLISGIVLIWISWWFHQDDIKRKRESK